MDKKTKIIATISDQRCEVDFIRSLFEEGMNAVRINSAHVTPESAMKVVENVRAVSEQIAIIIDTKGPEIRITGMEPQFADGIPVAVGDQIRVQGTDANLPSGRDMIYMNETVIYDDVPVGASMLIDDGELEIVVTDKHDGTLYCEVKNPGVLRPHKSVNVPGVSMNLPSVTERDRMFIEWAIEKDLDFIAHSFVRTKKDVLTVKKIVKAHNSPIRIISKIENREGVEHIDEILEETYGVMVARGDLGVEIPAEQIPVTQRYIVSKCIASKTPVIIATQMLHSMIHSPRPTRAEVSDIAAAIYERVDAVMLSGETANGDYPMEAVRTMARVAREIERDATISAPYLDLNLVRINNEITAQLSRSAVRACQNLPVRAIVIDTLTGRTGRYLAAFRGQKPVYAACYKKTVMRQLALSYGVHAFLHDAEQNDLLPHVLAYLQEKKWLFREDLVVVVGGSFGKAKGASYMEIANVYNLAKKICPENNFETT